MKALLFTSLFFLTLSAQAAIDPVVDAADRRDAQAPALLKAAQSHYPKRRVLAAHAYGELMSPAGIEPLFTLLEDPMPFVREDAAFALGQLGWKKDAAGGREAEIRKRLAALLRDKRASVRAAAVEAGGKVGGEGTWDLVEPALSDKDESVRASAAMQSRPRNSQRRSACASKASQVINQRACAKPLPISLRETPSPKRKR
jgi:HEAT repeat protein